MVGLRALDQEHSQAETALRLRQFDTDHAALAAVLSHTAEAQLEIVEANTKPDEVAVVGVAAPSLRRRTRRERLAPPGAAATLPGVGRHGPVRLNPTQVIVVCL